MCPGQRGSASPVDQRTWLSVCRVPRSTRRATRRRGGSSRRLLDLAPSLLLSQHHSTASLHLKRYEVEGRTNFLERRKDEVRRMRIRRTSQNTPSTHSGE